MDRHANAELRASVRRAADAQRPAQVADAGAAQPSHELEARRSANAVLEGLLAAHRAELLAFVERRAGGRVSAEDVVQKVALRAVRGAHQLRQVQAGRAWLFKITRHVLADEFRGAGITTTLELADIALDDRIEEFGCHCVAANLRQLEADHAQLLTRVVVDGTPLAELAIELGISVNAATVRLHRARAALRKRLRAHCGTTSLRACLDCSCAERNCCS